MADDPKLAEFRDKNIELMKERDDLKAALDADRARLAELEKAKPDQRITELETALATEKTARADAQKRADTFLIESSLSDVFLKNGGRPEARAFFVAQAAGQFVVQDGKLKSTKFSPDRPGEPMSLTEFVTLQTRENAFAFLPSGGGGADPKRGGGSTGVRELRDPTPQQLGEHAADVKAGRIKIVYS